MSEYVNYDGLKRYDELIKNVISVKTWIGSCSTAAGTAAKVISVESGFKLLKGVRIGVKFTASNTASNVTLNVNSTGAKSIYYNNAVYTRNSNMICGYANRYVFYVYDGTNWVWDGYGNHDNTSYAAMSTEELTTGTSTSYRVVRSDYLKAGIKSIVEGYGYTTNTGTVTSVAVKMNGTTKGTVTTSGTIDLGTVITAHQDISGKANTADLAAVATSGSYNDLSNKPTSLPASDVSSWAKASSKPSYAYSEIGYSVNAISSRGGTVSLAGTTPLHIVTLTGNVSALTLSSNPAAGHSCHVIFTAAAKRTIAIAHDATSRVCPGAEDISIEIPAGGYAEIDFLAAGGKVYVRGV